MCIQFSSVQSRPTLCDPHRLQHTRLPYLSPTAGACSNSCSSNWWCHPTISFSVVPFPSCLQSFQAPGSSPRSQFFASGGQSIGASASASVLPMNIQDWAPLGWTGWISLQSKRLSRDFSNTTVQTHQLFGTQLSLQPNSHIDTWLLVAMANHFSILAVRTPWTDQNAYSYCVLCPVHYPISGNHLTFPCSVYTSK